MKVRLGIFITGANGNLAGAMVGSPKVLKKEAPFMGLFFVR
jgi:hypothetical protein